MKKILLPTDFSEASDWATEAALGIAKRADAQIVLLHVIEEFTGQSFNVAGEWELSEQWEERLFTLKLINKAKGELYWRAQQLKEQGADVVTELKVGNAYHGIHSIIGEQQVDLVVMGTHGHTRWERMLVGSNTEKVIRQSRCPVLTIHEKPGTDLFKNIVYATAVDGDESAFSRIMKITQQLYDSTIHLVRVNTPGHFMPDRLVKKSMDDLITRLSLQNYTVNLFSDNSEEEGIIHFSDSINADLIGLATHSHSRFAHLLTGGISQGIVNHAKRPVLTYLTH